MYQESPLPATHLLDITQISDIEFNALTWVQKHMTTNKKLVFS